MKEFKKHSLLNDAVSNFVIRIIGVLATFCVTAFLARILGAEALGQYSIVVAAVTLLSIPAHAGIPELVLRECAKFKCNESWSSSSGIFRWANATVIWTSLLLTSISLVFIVIFNVHLISVSISSAIIALLSIPFAALAAVRGAALRGLGNVSLGLLPEYIIRPGAILTGLLISLIFSLKLNVNSAIYVYFSGAFFAFLFGSLILQIKAPDLSRKSEIADLDRGRWRRSAVVFAMMAGMTVLLQQMDVLMLGYFSDDKEVGLYRVSAQCSLVVSFGLTATLSAVAPHIVRANASGDLEKIKLLSSNVARFTTVVAFFAVLFLIFAGPIFLNFVFGSEFSAAYPALIALGASQFAISTIGPVSVLLVMIGEEKISAIVMAFTIIMNGILNFILIPNYGSVGAAIGTGCALIAQHFALSVAVKFKLGFFGGVLSRK